MGEYPEPGDLIEIYRGLGYGEFNEISRGIYKHWALYVGDGDVVHLTSASSCSSSSGRKGKSTVEREKLQDVVGKDDYRFNNRLDDHFKPRPIKDILKDAQSLVGERHPYNVIKSNCEHFATKLRYGTPRSLQTQEVEAAGTAVGMSVRLLWNEATGKYKHGNGK